MNLDRKRSNLPSRFQPEVRHLASFSPDLLSPGPAPRSQVEFLTGKAGTGKSFALKRFADSQQGRCIVLAPTGLAAQNVGGQTIHSFFKIPPRTLNDPKVEVRRFMRGDHRLKAIQECEWIVIDEVSMVRADLLDAVDWSLRKNLDSNLPFGGKRVLLVGDLAQLPPVVKRNAEQEFIVHRYGGSPYFLSSRVMQEVAWRVWVLTRSYRHADDDRFLNLLGLLRDGDDSCIEAFNERVRGILPRARVTVLTARKNTANEINERRLAKLPGEADTFTRDVRIYDEAGHRQAQDEHDLPVPYHLFLKPEARVMLLKNGPGYANGSLGTVVELGGETIVVRLDSGDLVSVERAVWEQIRFVWNPVEKRIDHQVVSEYIQFPMTLAWAITVHKSQGLTLRACAIDLGAGAFAHGQFYVAVSRVPTFDSFSLKQPLQDSDIAVDHVVRDFHASIGLH